MHRTVEGKKEENGRARRKAELTRRARAPTWRTGHRQAWRRHLRPTYNISLQPRPAGPVSGLGRAGTADGRTLDAPPPASLTGLCAAERPRIVSLALVLVPTNRCSLARTFPLSRLGGWPGPTLLRGCPDASASEKRCAVPVVAGVRSGGIVGVWGGGSEGTSSMPESGAGTHASSSGVVSESCNTLETSPAPEPSEWSSESRCNRRLPRVCIHLYSCAITPRPSPSSKSAAAARGWCWCWFSVCCCHTRTRPRLPTHPAPVDPVCACCCTPAPLLRPHSARAELRDKASSVSPNSTRRPGRTPRIGTRACESLRMLSERRCAAGAMRGFAAMRGVRCMGKRGLGLC